MGKFNPKVDAWIEDRAWPQHEMAKMAAVKSGLSLLGAGTGAMTFLMWLSKHICHAQTSREHESPANKTLSAQVTFWRGKRKLNGANQAGRPRVPSWRNRKCLQTLPDPEEKTRLWRIRNRLPTPYAPPFLAARRLRRASRLISITVWKKVRV